MREHFKTKANAGIDFKECTIAVLPKLNEIAIDAYNWQLNFDLLYWDWLEAPTRDRIQALTLDKIALELSPYKNQKEEIDRQIQAAEEWREALEEAEMTHLEAIGLTQAHCEHLVESEQRSTNIAKN
jgi:hypothetical protein